MATGALTEQAVEAVASNLEGAAEATRQISQHTLRYFFGGVGLGGVLGFFSGYRFTKQRIRAEILKEAEETVKAAFEKADKEIEEVRNVYRQKAVALDNEVEKAKVEGKVESIVEREAYSASETQTPEPEVKTLFYTRVPAKGDLPEAVKDDKEKSKDDNWDYSEELKHRQLNPRLPYVIHQDEFSQGTVGYNKSTFTYYAPDEVLVDEGGNKIDNPARFVGVENLEKFGHGADDYDVVFIRNNALQLEIEVCRINNRSYEEHVLGLSRDDVENS